MNRIKTSGPLFDGRAEAAAREGTDEVRRRLAADAEKLIIAAFTTRIREDHGHFLHSIVSTRVSRTFSTHSGHKTYTLPAVVVNPSTDTMVTTDIASYGPWLEGTGSRNNTTRFKGYHGFRLAGQELQTTAKTIAEAVFRPYGQRMN